jgi:hypothetical protein
LGIGDREKDKGIRSTRGRGAKEQRRWGRWGRWGVLKKNTEYLRKSLRAYRICEFRIFWLLTSGFWLLFR